jgi:polar amino acid transport system substrate-binding protein
MRELQVEGRVRIGIPDDAPPLGYTDRAGAIKGFSVALGRVVADALHVRPEIRAYPSYRLQGLVDVGGLDVAFPLTPLTERVVRRYSASDPYVVGHQRLLVPRSSTARGVDDLAGATVCAHLDPQTGVALSELVPGVRVETADDLARCRRDLARGRVDAVTAQDFLLVHVRDTLAGDGSPATKLVGDNLNTVGYAAAVIPQPGFAEFVRTALAAAEADGRWAVAYRRWIGMPPEAPPEMTWEEGAALWPLESPS